MDIPLIHCRVHTHTSHPPTSRGYLDSQIALIMHVFGVCEATGVSRQNPHGHREEHANSAHGRDRLLYLLTY